LRNRSLPGRQRCLYGQLIPCAYRIRGGAYGDASRHGYDCQQFYAFDIKPQ